MQIKNRVELTIENHVARVELNRPEKHNALDLEMFRAIVAIQNKLRTEKTVRAVVISGSGVDFCTGLDVKSIMKDRAGMIRLLWKVLPWRANLAQQVSVGWRRLQTPVFAAIHGRCWGGGLQIALGADFRYVEPSASLSIMEGKWGLIPDMGGTLALRELMPRDQAMLLAMSADEFSSARALELGLATRVTEDPHQAACEAATQLLQRSPDAVAAVKRLYRKSWQAGAGKALARESLYQVRILTGKNQRIAVRRQFGDKTGYENSARW
ncbi:crotonase/enoyl-CoA hydratase family protein [Pseudomonadota bacterium]